MNFSSTVNLNGLNYFINYDELTLQMKVGEGGNLKLIIFKDLEKYSKDYGMVKMSLSKN